MELMASQNVFPREVRSLTYTVPPASRVTRQENFVVLDEDVRITKVYIYFPPGCFVPGTPVLMEDGLEKPIEEVRVGDRVMSHMCSGTVTKTFKRKYVGWIYKIKPMGLFELAVTPEHPFLAIRRRKGQFKFSLKPEWIRACDLKPGYFLVTRIPTRVEDKKEIELDPTKNKKIGKLPVNDDLLEFIGFWLAEGWLQYKPRKGYVVGLTFGIHEREKVNRVCELIRKFGFSPYVCVRKEKNSIDVGFYSKAFYHWLLKNFGKGAREKRVPSWLMKLSFDKQKVVLQAMLEGDGHLHSKKGAWVLHTNNLELTRRLWLIANRVGYNPIMYTWTEKQGYGMEFRLNYSNNRRIKLLDTVLSPIHKIEREWYEGPVYNLEVEPYNSYLANLVCVHNCEDLVTIVLGVGSHVFAPQIISGDGKSLVLEPNRFVPAKTPIWAEITNYDNTYEHTPTIEIEFERIREVGVV